MKKQDTGRFTAEHQEMTDEQRESICYKSKLLNKYFDNYEDLLREEDAFKKAHEAELLAKQEKQDLLNKVKDAIACRIKEESTSIKIKKDAYANYLKICDDANRRVVDRAKLEQELLTEFCNKYGAFHESITVDDVTYQFEYTVDNMQDTHYVSFKSLLDFFK